MCPFAWPAAPIQGETSIKAGKFTIAMLIDFTPQATPVGMRII